MIGSSLPAATSLHSTPSSAPPPTSPRPRLRGLSYLRTYTHNHLSGRGSDSSPNLTRTTSSPPMTATETVPALPLPREHQQSGREGEANIQSGRSGWLPTVQGRSGLTSDSLQPASTTESASPERNMTRNRTTSAPHGPTAAPTPRTALRRASTMEGENEASDAHAGAADSSTSTTNAKELMPSIRFIPHQETRSSRPSLSFTSITRTLSTPTSVVRVGRYSERDNPTSPSSTSLTPVGFKSKVVSRRHCEFWCSKGQWYVKDVKSSSGTFLNHVRLSPPGQESKPWAVNDGDVVQLGIDFKGGEEVIFRCVKIRIECNRNWQKSLNSFNSAAHQRLIKTTTRESDAASTNSSECSICLNPVTPCQALFVAPCSHVWHFKCIRNLVLGPNFPNFLCPNCRFVADLEADVEPLEDFQTNITTQSKKADGQQEKKDDGEGSAEGSAEGDESNDGIARRTPSQDEEDDDDPAPLPQAKPAPRSEEERQHDYETLPVTLLNPPLPNPFENFDPDAPSPVLPWATRRRREATTVPSDSDLSSGNGTSAPWRSESTTSLDHMVGRSPTPTNDTAFALVAGSHDMENYFVPGAEDALGGG